MQVWQQSGLWNPVQDRPIGACVTLHLHKRNSDSPAEGLAHGASAASDVARQESSCTPLAN